MPFTFAHPAILVPFHRIPGKWFSQTALVIGCMVPDFEYFLRMNLQSVHSHTLAGLLYFNVPVGWVVWYVYEHWVRSSLGRHLPASLLRFAGEHFQRKTHEVQRWRVVVFSLFLGAISHLIWDAFTHSTGWVVNTFPGLNDSIAGFPVYKYLQHGSSFAGFLVLAWWFTRQPRPFAAAASHKNTRVYWAGAAFLSTVIFTIRFFLFPEPLQPGIVLVSAIGSTGWAILLTSVMDAVTGHRIDSSSQ